MFRNRHESANPSPAAGWENRERMSLLERGPADAVLALALIHHRSTAMDRTPAGAGGIAARIRITGAVPITAGAARPPSAVTTAPGPSRRSSACAATSWPRPKPSPNMGPS